MDGRGTLAAVLVLSLLTAAAAQADPARPSASPYLPRLSSYVQIRYTDPARGRDAIAVRRLKAMLDGGGAHDISYHVQLLYKTNLQSATDNHVYLQDAAVTVPSGSITLKIGQFIPPFGRERFEPDRSLDFVDRTNVTNQMVINGNLGSSFARDRGIQARWRDGRWKLGGGLFAGQGTNASQIDASAPLGVLQASYGQGSAECSAGQWSAGIAGSYRHDRDANFTAQFPGLEPGSTRHFQGRDCRFNGFITFGRGRLRGQAELFRTWLEPTRGAEIAAQGGYGRLAYHLTCALTAALRYEWFKPDLHSSTACDQDLWTVGVALNVPRTRLRVACDYSLPTSRFLPKSRQTFRVQLQWNLAGGAGKCRR